jgi:hypothetical protein
VAIKISVFWDITPCWLSCSCILLVRSVVYETQWLLAVHSVLRELTCFFPFPFCFLHNPKFRQADCSACHLLSGCFFAWLIPRPWRWRRHVPPKRRLTFNGPHGVVSHNMELSTKPGCCDSVTAAWKLRVVEECRYLISEEPSSGAKPTSRLKQTHCQVTIYVILRLGITF